MAGDLPVARVLVDVPFAHLDRPFDYLVPASMAAGAVPGARVSVPFSGHDSDGFVLDRVPDSMTYEGRLARLRRVVSAEPALARRDRQAGACGRRPLRGDGCGRAAAGRSATVRHGRAGAARVDAPARRPARCRDGPPTSTEPALLTALAGGASPRAVWNPGPVADWPTLLARLVASTLAGGRGALAVFPDARDVTRADWPSPA